MDPDAQRRRQKKVLHVFLRFAIDLVMRTCYIESDGKFYLQKDGVAMGSRVSPVLAILFMYRWETKLFKDSGTTPPFWKRYMDDILLLWRGGKNAFSGFVGRCNSLHSAIKVTTDQSNPLPVLDMTVRLEGTRVVTEFYRKPFASNITLHAESAHDGGCKKRVVLAETQRILFRCTHASDAEKHLGAYELRLRDSGYSTRWIRRTMREARQRFRAVCEEAAAGVRPLFRDRIWREQISAQKKKRGPPGVPVWWVSHNPRMVNSLRRAVRASGVPIQVRSVRGRTLKDILCRGAKAKGACSDPGCSVCKHIAPGRVESLGSALPCTVKDVVYTAKCGLCDDWYTGETARTLGCRVKEHNHAVQKGLVDLSALAAHCAHKHGGQKATFQFRVVRRGEGYVMRKCYEALHVDDYEPEINRYCPFRGVLPT